jgi:hypothetical protein
LATLRVISSSRQAEDKATAELGAHPWRLLRPAAVARDRGWDLISYQHLTGRHADSTSGSADLPLVANALAELGRLRVGPQGAGEVVGAAGEVPLDRLWHAVPAFPTLGEVWLRLLDPPR